MQHNPRGHTITDSQLYFAVFLFRFLQASSTKTQFDPDEFHQTLEPAFCFVQHPSHPCKGSKTWEWETPDLGDQKVSGVGLSPEVTNISLFARFANGPYRSSTNLWLYVIAYVNDSTLLIKLTNASLATALDIITAKIAKTAIMDRFYSLDRDNMERISLFLTCFGWFTSCSFTRSYANNWEALWCCAGLLLLIHAETSGNCFGRRFFAAVLCGLAFSLRFSSLFFLAPLLFDTVFARRRGYSTPPEKVIGVVVPIFIGGLVGVALALFSDFIFFTKFVVPTIANINFNILEGKSSLYGTHPFHWYFTVGMPAVVGAAIIPVFLNLAHGQRGQKSSAWRQTRRRIIMCYLFAHSLNAHKEFRFMTPIIPLCFVEASECIYYIQRRHLKVFAFLYLFLNLPLTIFLLTSWQGGGVKSALLINNAIKRFVPQQIDILLPCHSMPTFSYIRHSDVRIFETDCSPKCRADPNLVCNSDELVADVVGFARRRYDDSDIDFPIPSFIVAFSNSDLDEYLRTRFRSEFEKVATFFHNFDEKVVVLRLREKM